MRANDPHGALAGGEPDMGSPARDVFAGFCRAWEANRTAYLARTVHRSCPVCGGRTAVPLFDTQDGYAYVTCDGCAMVFVPDVVPFGVWNEYQRRDEIRALEEMRLARKLERRDTVDDAERFGAYFEVAKGHLSDLRGKRHLDIGTFYGDALRVGEALGLSCFGIEGREQTAEVARNAFGLNVEAACSDNMSEAVFGGDFDLVTAFEVLEHALDPGESLRRIYANLKPGGLVIVSVPNARNIEFSVLQSYCMHALGGVITPGHINMFGLDQLTRLLTETGFAVRQSFTQFGSSLETVWLFCAGHLEAIRCYRNIVADASAMPAVLDESRAVVNALGPAFNAWESSVGMGPILCVVAAK